MGVTTLIAIALALAAAVALGYGAMLQHSGVADDHDDAKAFGLTAVFRLFRDRTWVLGTLVMGLGIACNVIALAIAPVMVVQPIGAASLLVSVLLGVHYRGLRVGKRVGTSVIVCVAGVAVFVALSALTARSEVQDGLRANIVSWVGLGISALFLLTILVYRRPRQLVLVLGAGLQFGCVATNVHLVAVQFLHGGFGAVSWLAVAALVTGSAVGSWFVQAAYAAGPPETVIAGLTVIDPIFAVILGAVVLGEASHAPWWLVVVMAVTGLVACCAVVVLSRYHPDAIARERERKMRRAEDSAAQHN